MPNHIQNRLQFKGDPKQIEAAIEFLKGNERVIDFNQIVYMPKELEIASGSDGSMGWGLLFDKGSKVFTRDWYTEQFVKLTPKTQLEVCKLGIQYESNYKKHGHPTWYEWCIANWGTKWNAYEDHITEEKEIWFCTAWSSPVELMRKMSELPVFKNIEVTLTYADEDAGSNTGILKFLNGKITYINQEDSWHIYFELHPDHTKYYKWDEDEHTFVYIEEETENE